MTSPVLRVDRKSALPHEVLVLRVGGGLVVRSAADAESAIRILKDQVARMCLVPADEADAWVEGNLSMLAQWIERPVVGDPRTEYAFKITVAA